MSNLTYWQRRFLRIEEERDKKEQAYIQEMNERYNALSEKLQKEIDAWVHKYAVNDAISEAEANQLISAKERRTWSMQLAEFKRKAVEGGYEQELNREYYLSRITRLQELEAQLAFELAEQAHTEDMKLSAHLKDTLGETYLKHIFEITDRGSFSVTFATYSSKQLAVAIRKPWSGSDFSKRIWSNHLDYIPEKLSKTLSEAIAKGWGTDKTVSKMMEGVDKNLRNRMITLVQSESAHIAEEASQDSYRETKVDKYQWLATLETHTCDQCAGLDMKIFEVDGQDSMHPVVDTHPNCRCTTVPYIDAMPALTTRWQRDPITGKGSIQKVQSFEEWKKAV